MPPLVEIPVIGKHEFSNVSLKGKSPLRHVTKPRTYDDEPLPTKPSEHAPKNAQIVGRVLDLESGVTYQLKIGDVEINDVEIDDVLEYVSALALEEFENRQFEEEREVLRVAEAERERLQEENLERRKARAKRKGVVVFEEISDSDGENEAGEEIVGRHGRARPTYTHLFKKKRNRRGKRVMTTDGLLHLTGDEDDASSENGQAAPAVLARPSNPFIELSKRRRRKRDPVTGELLPLSPLHQPSISVEKKRQRRKRHPITKELMPLGWRYDPYSESDAKGTGPPGNMSPSLNQLNVTQEHDAKRPRLDRQRSLSLSTSPERPSIRPAEHLSPSSQRTFAATGRTTPAKPIVVDLLTSDDEPVPYPDSRIGSGLKPQPRLTCIGRSNNRMIQSTTTSSVPESSPEPQQRTPRRAEGGRTSILNPSAARASSTDAPVRPSDDDESEDDLDEDEWYIETILSHHLSDPKTHPKELGSNAVMLYQVKWEGYDLATWEPTESFGDQSVVQEYRERVGLGSEPINGPNEEAENSRNDAKTPSDVALHLEIVEQGTAAVVVNDDEDDDDDEEELEDDEFEVEAILTHHLSDPRTHPPEYGKTPLMLYRIKWKGFDELTWEPASSFGDQSVLREYQARAGLKAVDLDGDEEMVTVS